MVVSMVCVGWLCCVGFLLSAFSFGLGRVQLLVPLSLGSLIYLRSVVRLIFGSFLSCQIRLIGHLFLGLGSQRRFTVAFWICLAVQLGLQIYFWSGTFSSILWSSFVQFSLLNLDLMICFTFYMGVVCSFAKVMIAISSFMVSFLVSLYPVMVVLYLYPLGCNLLDIFVFFSRDGILEVPHRGFCCFWVILIDGSSLGFFGSFKSIFRY